MKLSLYWCVLHGWVTEAATTVLFMGDSVPEERVCHVYAGQDESCCTTVADGVAIEVEVPDGEPV